MGMTYKEWRVEEITGYKPQTTFYMDFSIADHFGPAAIKDTYKRAMRCWKKNYIYLTELVMVLNWKIWEHYDQCEQYATLYDALYHEADEYACSHLKDDELAYFYSTTD